MENAIEDFNYYLIFDVDDTLTKPKSVGFLFNKVDN